MIHFIRAPEFEGRPEVFIGDELFQEFSRRGDVKEYPGVLPTHEMVFPRILDNQFYDPNVAGRVLLQQIGQLHLEDGDKVFLVEAFSPLVFMLRYHIALHGLRDIQIGGIFHSATGVPGDLWYQDPAMERFEKAVLSNLDTLFVATKWLADHLSIRQSDWPSSLQVHVCGLPLQEPFALPHNEREDVVIFSHRLSDEKNWRLFADIALAAKNKGSKLIFRVLTPQDPTPEQKLFLMSHYVDICVCYHRADYFRLLKQAKIIFSSSLLETFGYAVLEGINHGLWPFVNDYACYPDLIIADCLYPHEWITYPTADSIAQMIARLEILCRNHGIPQGSTMYERFLTLRGQNIAAHATKNIVSLFLG